MFYYPHHIGDFIRDTARLNDSQCMAYLRLIWAYYDTESPLPDDAAKLAFQIGANEADVRLILEHFFELDANGMRTHKRCEIEITRFRAKSEKAKTSANARWKNANAMRTQCERSANESKNDANQEPRTNIKEKALSSPKADDVPFAEIVGLYHDLLPTLPRVKVLTDTRKRMLKARWHEDEKRKSLDFWERYFKYVGQHPFLVGENDRGWQADFEWLITLGNFVKVIEGGFERRAQA